MSDDNTIVECVFDIQFESNKGAESYISKIAKVNEFEQITKLPLHQIPDSIRKNDPNLKAQPLYEITSLNDNEHKIILGDNLIGMTLKGSYTSWEKSFYPQLKTLFSNFFDKQELNTISRMGLRYIDFLENEDIFETGKLKVDINNNDTKRMFLRIESSLDEIQCHKVIVNNEKYQNYNQDGSILDITTFIENCDIKNTRYDEMLDKINKLHLVNKNEFKEIISNEAIKKYGI